MVKVINSTAEADGTHKEYFLRVPPAITTAQEAVAWTFSMNSEEYQPLKRKLIRWDESRFSVVASITVRI